MNISEIAITMSPYLNEHDPCVRELVNEVSRMVRHEIARGIGPNDDASEEILECIDHLKVLRPIVYH